MEFLCRSRYPTPCIQYDPEQKEGFEAFLHRHGGQILSYDSDGRARFYTHKGSERCPVYAKPGHYVRCIGPGQFSVCSAESFAATYEAVEG